MEALAAATRSGYIESVHYGYICVVNLEGEVIFHLGDYNTRTFIRSAAKPLQVIPLIHSGAASKFSFTDSEIAIACASHSGQPVHQSLVRDILNRLDLDLTDLSCGIMEPLNINEKARLIKEGRKPTVLHNSCSGKHAAMLALAKYKGYPLDGYININHPVQQNILEYISCFAGVNNEKISIGIDGCGLPIYLLPLYNIALSYCRLMKNFHDRGGKYHTACKRIVDSMLSYPEMVAGEGGFCTELMKIANGKVIGKFGMEGIYCLGVKKGSLGIVVKISDGNLRALYPVVIHLLHVLDILGEEELEKLKSWYNASVVNSLNQHVGEIMPIFKYSGMQNNDPMGINMAY